MYGCVRVRLCVRIRVWVYVGERARERERERGTCDIPQTYWNIRTYFKYLFGNHLHLAVGKIHVSRRIHVRPIFLGHVIVAPAPFWIDFHPIKLSGCSLERHREGVVLHLCGRFCVFMYRRYIYICKCISTHSISTNARIHTHARTDTWPSTVSSTNFSSLASYLCLVKVWRSMPSACAEVRHRPS